MDVLNIYKFLSGLIIYPIVFIISFIYVPIKLTINFYKDLFDISIQNIKDIIVIVILILLIGLFFIYNCFSFLLFGFIFSFAITCCIVESIFTLKPFNVFTFINNFYFEMK